MDQNQVQAPSIVVTEHMINSLRATKPWTLFISILGFAGMAIMILAGLFMMVAGQFFMHQRPHMMTAMGLLYIIMGVLYLFPMIYLYKYSSAIARFISLKQAFEMESALGYQKSFWKFVGIICLIMIIVAILGIIAAIGIGVMVGMKS